MSLACTFLVMAMCCSQISAWVSDTNRMTSWRWRYEVSRGITDESGTFFRVRLQVLDVASPLWEIHSSAEDVCTISDEMLPIAYVTCSSPIHLVIQVSDPMGMTDQFSIRLVSFIQDLVWLVSPDSPLAPNTTMTLSIWLRDAVDNDSEDDITRHMFESGESPSVSFSTPSVRALGPVTFNETSSRWVVPIAVAAYPAYCSVLIAGSGVSFMTYQAKDAYLPLFIQLFSPTWSTVSLPPVKPGELRRHVCGFATMALPYPGTDLIAFTQDMFSSFDILRLPLDLGETVVDVAFTRTTFVVVTSRRVLYSPDMRSLYESNGVESTFNFNHAQLRATELCDDLLMSDGSLSPNNKMVLLLSSKSLYVSMDGGMSYSPVSLPSTNFTIVSAILEYGTNFGLTTVFRDNMNTTMIYEYDNGSWIETRKSSTAISTLISSVVGSRDTFIVDPQGVQYTPNSGSSSRRLRMTARSPSGRSGLGQGEFVKHLTPLPTGTSFAVLTSANRIFYGILPLTDIIEVQSGIKANASWTYLIMEPKRDIPGLGILLATPTGIHFQKIPLENEIRGTRASPKLDSLLCPYTSLTLPSNSPTYIDMGDNATFLTSFKTNLALQTSPIAVAVDDAALLQISSTTEIDISESGTSDIENVVLVQESDSIIQTARDDRVIGMTSFSMRLLQGNHACGKVMVATRVRVGCPPGTSISVRDSENGPIPVFHQTTGYRPVVDLYRDGNFIEEMTGDYVLQELTGRSDHQYTATASQIGCVRSPQSWERLNGVPWTPQNNIDCFSAAPTGNADNTDWMSTPYEVLNSTSKNMLKFRNQADDGFMTFQITVVDLNFSYCNLSTTFVIELYGRPLDTLTAVLTLTGLATFMMTVFVISYFCYRREIMLNKKNE